MAGLTTVIVDLLRAELPFRVGDGSAPLANTGQEERLDLEDGPFLVVYELAPAYTSTGWTGQVESQARMEWQVSASGLTREQAATGRDMALDVLVGKPAGGGPFTNPLTVAGLVVMDRGADGIPVDKVGTYQAGFRFWALVNVAA
jgi:hypothetical protein